MKTYLVHLMLLMLIASHSARADKGATAPWPIEVHCAAEPIQQPKNWTYPGALLMSGYAGIHAIQKDWETPRVVALFYNASNGDTALMGGQLSPDGKWYAVPIGEYFTEVSFNVYQFVHSVRVYSTVDNTVLNFDLRTFAGNYVYYPVAWSYLPVEWVDNQSFIIGGIRLFPFENRAEESKFASDWSSLSERYMAPDQTLAYSGYGIDGEFRTGLYDPRNPKTTFIDVGHLENVVWKRDSSGFMAQDDQWNGLAMFNREGQEIERIFELKNTHVDFGRNSSGRNEIPWSSDDSKFTFTLHMPYPYTEPDQLYLIDFRQRQVINTCLKPTSAPIWSPDGKYIAYLETARENLKLIVFSIEDWQAYIVGFHSGISGVLRPDMIGWRINDP